MIEINNRQRILWHQPEVELPFQQLRVVVGGACPRVPDLQSPGAEGVFAVECRERLFRQEIQKRRLFEVHCKRLLEGAVKNRVAGHVDEVREQHGILLGQGRYPHEVQDGCGSQDERRPSDDA